MTIGAEDILWSKQEIFNVFEVTMAVRKGVFAMEH